MKLLKQLKKTPLHPQWFAFLREEQGLRDTCRSLTGLVLDVGCAESKPRAFLPQDAEYVGLDYYDTATGWYKTRPDLFGDAQQLPFATEIFDHVLLLDVLEHIPDADRCLNEISRVLKPGGTLTVQVPFMYPIHDAPLDFHRWTRFGLARAARAAGFSGNGAMAIGHPLETAALCANIAMSKTILNWMRQYNPLAILGIALPAVIVAVNGLAWLGALLGRSDDFMPYAYRAVWTKN